MISTAVDPSTQCYRLTNLVGPNVSTQMTSH
jgi:hypothetical protein